MDEWFSIAPIDERTYAISEYGHFEETHAYLLIGETGAFLIDAGMGIGNILDPVRKLTDLNVTVLLTHVHWDHIGGCISGAMNLMHSGSHAAFPFPKRLS